MSADLNSPRPHGSDDAFVAEQRAHWSAADRVHFDWQTRGAYFAETEAALLDGVEVPAGGRLLEVGCGQGGNLFHLARRLDGRAHLVGVDFTPDRVRFAAQETGLPLATADATRLPFCNATFDSVLIRDLLHHLPEAARHAALLEARRVLKPGGRFFLVEPCGRNPLIAAAALAEKAERGMLAQTAKSLESDVRAAGFAVRTVEPRQPMPISRVVLHPKMGVPKLGGSAVAKLLLSSVERAAEVLPKRLWAYVFIVAAA